MLAPSPRSPWAAQQAAQLVDVEYGPPPSTSSGEGKDASPSLDVPLVPRPILSIDDALAAGSFTPIPPFFPFPSRPGDSVGKGKSLVLEGGCAPGARAGGGKGKDAAPSTSPGQPGRSMQGVLDGVGAPSAAQVALEGPEGGGAGGGGASGAGEGPSPAAGPGAVVVTGRYSTPSQQHVYMETQSAVAWPDEDGMVHVWSGTQSIDIVQVGGDSKGTTCRAEVACGQRRCPIIDNPPSPRICLYSPLPFVVSTEVIRSVTCRRPLVI